MRTSKRMIMAIGATVAMAAACADGGDGAGGGARYDREVRGGSLHHAPVEGVTMGGVELERVLASARELDPAVAAVGAGELSATTAMIPGPGGAAIAYVSARQILAGVPIADSHLYLALAPAQGGAPARLLASSYRLFHGADVDVTPAIDRDRAEALGREVLRAPADAPLRDAALVIRELEGELALVWDVTVVDHDGRAVVHAAGIRAGSADAVDDRVYETEGAVTAWVAAGGAPGAGGRAQVLAQRDTFVRAGTASATTGGDGRFTVGAAEGSTVTAAVAGLAARVKSAGSGGVTAAAPAAPSVNLVLGAATGEHILAQTTAYHYVTAARRALVDAGLDADALGPAITTNVNIADSCNAYFSPGGRTLNFFRSGGGCNNSAEASIVLHEYGHVADDAFGGIHDGGLSEGWGDTLACFLLGRPVVGGDLFQDGTDMRSCANDYRYPRGGRDEEHELGQAWAGFAWDVRTGLVDRLGADQGAALASALVLPSLGTDAPDIPSAVREVFLRDDDDGDLGNGTPHWDVLLAAAQRHRLDFVVSRDLSPPSAITDLTVTARTPTSVTLGWTAPGDDGATGTAASYELRWSLVPIDESTFAAANPVPAPLPVAAGQHQTATVRLPVAPRIHLALRALDDLRNTSRLSNVVTVDLPPPHQVFHDGAERGMGAWRATGMWHVSTRRAGAGRSAFWYGDETTGTYDTPGVANRGTLLSPAIDLTGIADPQLSWLEHVDVESAALFDMLRVEVVDAADTSLVLGANKQRSRTTGFHARLLDLTGFGGRTIRIRFSIDTHDAASNRGEGWFLDEIRVLGEPRPTLPPAVGRLLINEVLADPPLGYDANGDGVASYRSDEMLELLNIGGTTLDLSGVTISDAVTVQFTFPAGTTLAPGHALAVYGGAAGLSLNNDGDTVAIRSPTGTLLAHVTYGAEGGDDQSLTRATDGEPDAPLVKHRTRSSLPASPGRRADGAPF